MKCIVEDLNINSNMAILSRICNNLVVTDKVQEYCMRNYVKIFKYKNKLICGKWLELMKKAPIFRLSVVAMCLKETLNRYGIMGIEESIYYDTFDDLRIWIQDCMDTTGEIGLQELNWIRLHVNLEIFKLGRLQFQLSKYYFSPIYKDNGKSIRFGQKCLNMHIPRGAKLNIEECNKSVVAAREFFPKYFKEYSTEFIMCHSWLLYSNNKKFMKPDGNILNFAEMFNIVGENEAPSQTLLWVFNLKIEDNKLFANKRKYGKYCDYELLPSNTALQYDLIKYLTKGGLLGDAKGMLKLN